MRAWAILASCLAAIACLGLIVYNNTAHQTSLQQKNVVYYRQNRINSLPVAVARPLAANQHIANAHYQQRSIQHSVDRRFGKRSDGAGIAAKRAKEEAEKDYLKTYNMAIQAENAEETQERKYRALRAKHEQERTKVFNELKNRANKKEGWDKLEREMGMIMDGVDGLHYKGYARGH
ncbi:hypothetical protein GUITHDRAFT_118545 [Guillardia theta CCMP2712]|uniref:Uncharacterized protein n=1 Tax=Guillardia theta (strain CCMP2712) TaxID=905079 RepID=L1IGD7_GUITC|nr:hypothetical protein GUITHDRAFT_118545 [Guillardia theta CCMP2712]EKX35311.1 hypothetical protein GUITHDRAFT_118545 [Guillardia theta CCMP2712]|eukprot:XP_005822291.1 hypothetical protein GUITHDRAFT_118545 [Guillardia theta CCMP2712]